MKSTQYFLHHRVLTAITDRNCLRLVRRTILVRGSRAVFADFNLSIYIFFFASSWGPVAWVVTGEMFPLKVRAKCLSMTTATNWLLNFAIAYATPYMVNEGPGYANLQSKVFFGKSYPCLLYTSPSPRDGLLSRMPSSA